MVKITDKNKDVVVPALSTAVLLAVLAFTEQQQHLHGLGERTLRSAQVHEIFLLIASIMALVNLSGLPEKFVKEHWETQGFGAVFFPTPTLTNVQKRQIAGFLEMLGILMAATDENWKASVGYGWLCGMYARGAYCNIKIGQVKKALVVGSAAVWAAWFTIRELQSMYDKEEFLQLPVVPLPDVSEGKQMILLHYSLFP